MVRGRCEDAHMTSDGQMGRRNDPWTTGELAREFGKSIRTIIRWVDQGEFGEFDTDWWKTPGGKRRVRSSAVEQFGRRRY